MLKNKFLLVFCIMLLFFLLLIFSNKVSAVFQVESNNDDTIFYNLPDLPEKPENTKSTLITLEVNEEGVEYFYLYYLGTRYENNYDAYFGSKFSSNYQGHDIYNIYACCDTGYRLYYYICPINDTSSWSERMGGTYRSDYSVLVRTTYSPGGQYIKDFLYSDKDIYICSQQSAGVNYKYIPTDEIFFHKASTWKVNLFKVRQLEEILPMVNKLVTILMKVGLKVFSVLLVVYLIASKKWRRI